jgi:hypothetical protein
MIKNEVKKLDLSIQAQFLGDQFLDMCSSERALLSAPLFLRKLVLGIPAQASGKNHVAINAFGAPIRPIQNESGSSLRGRSRISKAGSPVIRAKLYMATISVLQHNPDIKYKTSGY